MNNIVVSANSSWNIVNFRSGLIRFLVERGFQVHVVAPSDSHSTRISDLGASFHPIHLNSSGRSPLDDAGSLIAYYRLLKVIRPDAFLGFTVKPNIYGSFAAHALGIKVINNISGLGVAFTRRGPLRWLVETLYRLGLRRSDTVFFQNPDDLTLFRERRLVDDSQARLLAGSGVDLDRFRPSRSAERDPGPFRFLMVGRMLWDKGVGQYVEAARIFRQRVDPPEFALLGPAGVDNRSAISLSQLKAWEAEGVICYFGESDDVRPYLARADCVVLPSYYREGIPRSLIEAAAMGRPVITTDEVGCREAVDDGRTGFLCQARSVELLVQVMDRMLALDKIEIAAMGEGARLKAERQFDERLIGEAYCDALRR